MMKFKNSIAVITALIMVGSVITACNINDIKSKVTIDQQITGLDVIPQGENSLPSDIELTEAADGASLELPENFPVNYVPMIGAAVITATGMKVADGQTEFIVKEKLNISSADCYLFYNDLFKSSLSFNVLESEEGTMIKVERSKSGLTAILTFTEDNGGGLVTIDAVVVD